MKCGNQNTQFFHAQIVIRRKWNHIAGLFVDDNWCIDEEVLRRETLHFFKHLFCAHDVYYPSKLVLTTIPQLSITARDSLIKPVTKEKVHSALMAMDSYKAPRLDGFQVVFFKTY